MVGLLLAMLSAFAGEFGPSLEGDSFAPPAAQAADTGGVVGCSSQYLDDGEQLPDLPLFFNRMSPSTAWGSPVMVETLVGAARHMRWLMPDSDPITIGDISTQHGGYLSGHVSHRAGVDADVGLYRTGGHQGRGFDNPGSDFDLEANWAFVSALLDTGDIDFILLDQSHINKLRAYALSNGLLTEAEAARIFPTTDTWRYTGILRHASGHDNHFHVRVLCPDGSRAR